MDDLIGQELLNRDSPDYSMIDEVLATYPLENPPDNLLPSVLTRIQAIADSAPAPVEPAPSRELPLTLPSFHLTWLDVALSLFISLMIGLVMASVYLLPYISNLWRERLYIQLILMWQHTFYGPPVYLYLLGSLGALSLIAILGGILSLGHNRRFLMQFLR